MRDLSTSFWSGVVVTGIPIDISFQIVSPARIIISYKIPKLDPIVQHPHPAVMEYL